MQRWAGERSARIVANHETICSKAAGFTVRFGATASGSEAAVTLPMRVLGGSAIEEIFGGARPLEATAGLELYRGGGLIIGHAAAAFVPEELVERTRALYARVIAACEGRPLFRIWNYVPRINAITAGEENYRAFCAGRSLAFEAAFGTGFVERLPAASAVGCGGEQLEVVFVAGEEEPRHFENPAQVPAYRYPVEHGPRSPSFARATVARDGERELTFISGTAAIKGHETVAPGSLDVQLDCTLDNLRLISVAAGLGERLAGREGSRRHFKIYLRRAADFERVRARLEHSLLTPTDAVTYLEADICRAALDLEIEATVISDVGERIS